MEINRETEINYLATFSKETLKDMLKLAERQKQILENDIIRYKRKKWSFIPAFMDKRIEESTDRISVINAAIQTPKRERGDY
jgi:hypothetical protein